MGILSCILSAYLSITIGHQKLMYFFFKSSRPAQNTSAFSNTLVCAAFEPSNFANKCVFSTIWEPCECHHTPQFRVLEKETKGTTPSCFEKKVICHGKTRQMTQCLLRCFVVFRCCCCLLWQMAGTQL